MTKKKEVTPEVEISSTIAKMWKPLATVLILALFGYGVFMGVQYYQASQEEKAQEELFTIQKKLETKKEELAKAEDVANKDAEKMTAANKKKNKADAKMNKAAEVKNTQSLEKNFADILVQYEAFIKAHPQSKAAYMAAVQAAGLATDYNDLPRAEKYLRSVVDQPKSHDLFFGLLHSQLATVLMDLNKYADAEKVYGQIIDNKSQSYFHPQALLHLSACYIEEKDFDKALAVLTRLQSDYGKTQAAQQAKNYKKLLTLKRAQKSS